MFELTIEDRMLEKLEELFKKSPFLAEESIKISLKKSVAILKKLEIQHMKKTYTADETVISSKFVKTRVKKHEAQILGATKRNNIENFNVSMKKPGKSKEKMKAQVIKKHSLSTMRTMFWGFYKSNGKSGKITEAGLYIRNGEERYKISPVKTVSIKQMGMIEVPEKDLEQIKEIFYKELDKKISEVL